MKYLLDTNICIYFFKGLFNLKEKIAEIGYYNIALSELTLAELYYGAEKSAFVDKNKQIVDMFSNNLTVLPISNSIELYAREKARLRKIGQIISDFDLLIGTTAITYNLIMVTRNLREFERIHNITLENWAN